MLLICIRVLFWNGDKSSGFHDFKKIQRQTLALVHSSACHLSSRQMLTAVEPRSVLLLPIFVNSTFEVTYFAYILSAYQLAFTFSSFLPTLAFHFIPEFPLHLLASCSAPAPLFISLPLHLSLPLKPSCSEHPTRTEMSLPLFIGISFPRLYPISFTAHLTLERFLIKPEWIESTVVHLNCCQGRISFGRERIFSQCSLVHCRRTFSDCYAYKSPVRRSPSGVSKVTKLGKTDLLDWLQKHTVAMLH